MPKGFGYGGESAGQERKNLLKDNPVAKDASGGRSWMSKHSKSALRMDKPDAPLRAHHPDGSAMEKGHPDGSAMKKHGSMAEMHTPFHKFSGKKDYKK